MKRRFSLVLTFLFGSLLLTCISCGNSDPLNNTGWYVVKINSVVVNGDIYISLSFYNGRLEGHDGCNRYSAEYSIEDPDILNLNLREMTMTMQGCIEDENAMKQRSAYFGALGKVSFYKITGNILIFYDSERQDILVFNRRQVHLMNPADLIGTDWILESLNDIAVPEGLEISLSFSSESEASGHAGNYSYRLLDYEAKGDIIRWGIQVNRDGEISTDLERFALNYLDSISTGTHQYNQTEDKLELFTSRGDRLVYKLLIR